MNQNDTLENMDLDLSVVLPVYNEEDNVEHVYDEITQALATTSLEYEIVFVNDGSSDNTLEKLRALNAKDSRAVVVEFRRNFGQTAAMAAGFDYARGEIVVTMDADRQNDARDIPMMLEKMAEGFDMVCGWRHQRQDGYWLRLLPSKLANRLISWITDVKLNDYGCTLKAFKREVVERMALYGEMHRFIPAIASMQGVTIAEVKVNHRARVAGESKYGISRTFRVILDLITVKYFLSYSSRPLQVFGVFGMISGGLGVLLGLIMAVQRLVFHMPLSDRPLLLLAILLVFIGIQFITVGLLAEMQTRTYHESQRKPIYVVREVRR